MSQKCRANADLADEAFDMALVIVKLGAGVAGMGFEGVIDRVMLGISLLSTLR